MLFNFLVLDVTSMSLLIIIIKDWNGILLVTLLIPIDFISFHFDGGGVWALSCPCSAGQAAV